MIRISQKYEENEVPAVDIAPLVDIIFNLLIFFLLTAVITTQGISVSLPKSLSDEAIGEKLQELALLADGTLYTDEQIMNRQLFENWLRNGGLDAQKPLVVKAEAQTPFQDLIAVIDLLREYNCENIIFATEHIIPEK
jgi:biopolymer transport protein ExbD